MSTVTTSHAPVRSARRFALIGAIVVLAATGIVLIVLALTNGGSGKSSVQPRARAAGLAAAPVPGHRRPRGAYAQSRVQSGSGAIEPQTPGQRP